MIFLKNICGLVSRCLATCLETKAHHLAPFVQKESSVLQMGKVSVLQGEWGLPHSIDNKLQVKANLDITHNAGPGAWTKVAGKILDPKGRTVVWVKQATYLLCLIRTWSTAFPLEYGKNMRCGCWNPQSICPWSRKPSPEAETADTNFYLFLWKWWNSTERKVAFMEDAISKQAWHETLEVRSS